LNLLVDGLHRRCLARNVRDNLLAPSGSSPFRFLGCHHLMRVGIEQAHRHVRTAGLCLRRRLVQPRFRDHQVRARLLIGGARGDDGELLERQLGRVQRGIWQSGC
jgi:hypothetical protein